MKIEYDKAVIRTEEDGVIRIMIYDDDCGEMENFTVKAVEVRVNLGD